MSTTSNNPTATTTEPEHIRMQIAGQWRDGLEFQEVRDPYRGGIVAYAPLSTERDRNDALDTAQTAMKAMADMPGYERAAMLRRAADAVSARAEDIARAMSMETGKALSDSLVEAKRSSELLRLCAEEAVRIQGEHVPAR